MFEKKYYEKESCLIDELVFTCQKAMKLDSYDILTLFFWKTLINILCDLIKVYNLKYESFLVDFDQFKKLKKL